MEDVGFDLSWDEGNIKIGLKGESYLILEVMTLGIYSNKGREGLGTSHREAMTALASAVKQVCWEKKKKFLYKFEVTGPLLRNH